MIGAKDCFSEFGIEILLFFFRGMMSIFLNPSFETHIHQQKIEWDSDNRKHKQNILIKHFSRKWLVPVSVVKHPSWIVRCALGQLYYGKSSLFQLKPT